MSAPVVLTIAGSDCSAGAGIQADLKTFAAMGVYGCSVITANTAQNYKQLVSLNTVSAEVVLQQMNAVLDAFDISAIKLGMLGSVENARVVSHALGSLDIPVVIDPVLSASVGGCLSDGNGLIDFYRQVLIPQATLVTPNLNEAALLLNTEPAVGHDAAQAQALQLLALGSTHILLKGGHGSDERLSTDYLASSGSALGSVQAFSAARLKTEHGHGTGCTLASAIAAGLAQGLTVAQAVATAKNYLQASLMAAGRLDVVPTNGPLHHFSTLW